MPVAPQPGVVNKGTVFGQQNGNGTQTNTFNFLVKPPPRTLSGAAQDALIKQLKARPSQSFVISRDMAADDDDVALATTLGDDLVRGGWRTDSGLGTMLQGDTRLINRGVVVESIPNDPGAKVLADWLQSTGVAGIWVPHPEWAPTQPLAVYVGKTPTR